MDQQEQVQPPAETSKKLEGLSDYDRVILEVFRRHYEEGDTLLTFAKDELQEICHTFGIVVRNIPDIVYTYRSRRRLPADILATGNWAIESAGRSKYAFRLLANEPHFDIRYMDYAPINIYNAIPEVVEGLLRNDEQALLTRILYNRLIDIFTGLTCFHIQNHFRAFVKQRGQVEVDSLYVGVDQDGQLWAIPIEAKSQSDSDLIGRVQISQMAKLVRQEFPDLKRRLLAVKLLIDGSIAVVEFNDQVEPDDFGIVMVRRFQMIRRSSP